MLSDLRYAFRQLVKSPGFTVIAVLTLALGIGANTAIFSVINSALLRPLPFPDAHQLVQVWSKGDDGGHWPRVQGSLYKLWRDAGAPFASLALVHDRVAFNLLEEGRAERIDGAEVSANYLDVLGVKPALGHNFPKGADVLGGDRNQVLLTYEWWVNRFGSDRDIVGRNIDFNETRYTVIGVLPPRTMTNRVVKFLVPLVLEDAPWRTDPTTPWVGLTARLRPGSTAESAAAEASALAKTYLTREAPSFRFNGVHVQSMQELLVESSRSRFVTLMVAVGLVLLIACANVANLMLARAKAREQEMAVRLALGASARQIVHQLLVESLLLAFLGGLAGLLVASFSLDLLNLMTAQTLPAMMKPELDARVLIFSLLVACGTGVLFGLFPALKASQLNPQHNLKDAGRGSTSGSRTKAQSSLSVAEIALTVMLLIGTGIMLRSFAKLLLADPGFNPRQTLVCNLSLGSGAQKRNESVDTFVRVLTEHIAALPGVEAVGTATTLPLGGDSWGCWATRSDQPSATQPKGSALDFVGGDYFRAIGITLVKGRLLTEADNSTTGPRVIVVNESFVSFFELGGNPVGQHIRFRDADWEVVGVVSSVRQMFFDQAPWPHVYAVRAFEPRDVCFVIRTSVAPLGLVEDVRQVVASLDSTQSVSKFRTLEQSVVDALGERRIALYLVGLFGAVALGLACLGIYGVLSYSIGLRSRELSIRMALGAQQGKILRLVLSDGVILGAIGIATGLVGALAGTRILSSQLYEISAYDPLVFVSVPVLVGLVTLLAVFIPARRATTANPIEALRAE